jgi:hypothetical protein
MNLSAVCAHFSVTKGRCRRWKCHESAVQLLALRLQHADGDVDARFPHLADAEAVHLRKGSTQPTTQRRRPRRMMRSAQGGVLP